MIKLSHSSVFMIGGFQNDIISNRTWIADPLNGFEMKEGPSLNVGRYGHSCGKMISNGKVVLVVAGGRDQARYLESIEILDPSSGRGWIFGTFNYIVNFQMITVNSQLQHAVLLRLHHFLGQFYLVKCGYNSSCGLYTRAGCNCEFTVYYVLTYICTYF